MADLADQELEEPVQLVGVAAHCRGHLCRIGVGRGLDGPYLHLEPAAEPLHASEHVDGIPFGEATVEQLDVVPDPRLDPAALVDELEREVGGAVLRPAALLLPDRVDAFDGAILGELGDGCHAGILGRAATLGPWPTSPPFAPFATRRRPPRSLRRPTTCSRRSSATSSVRAILTTSFT